MMFYMHTEMVHKNRILQFLLLSLSLSFSLPLWLLFHPAHMLDNVYSTNLRSLGPSAKIVLIQVSIHACKHTAMRKDASRHAEEIPVFFSQAYVHTSEKLLCVGHKLNGLCSCQAGRHTIDPFMLQSNSTWLILTNKHAHSNLAHRNTMHVHTYTHRTPTHAQWHILFLSLQLYMYSKCTLSFYVCMYIYIKCVLSLCIYIYIYVHDCMLTSPKLLSTARAGIRAIDYFVPKELRLTSESSWTYTWECHSDPVDTCK